MKIAILPSNEQLEMIHYGTGLQTGWGQSSMFLLVSENLQSLRTHMPLL